MSFDYHLSERERTKIERIVPLHQAKIHLAFRADFTLNGKKYKEGGIALSEHLIVLTKKSVVGKSLSEVTMIHLLDLESFSTSSDTQCKLSTAEYTLLIVSPAVLRFARVLIRNYYVITIMFPPDLRFQFKPHDPNAFPPFNPQMSPSQMYQFSYNANCSYYNVTYFHELVQYFHTLVISGNGIADLANLPVHLLEMSMADPIDLRPVFAAMMFCPIVFGVMLNDIARPDIIKAIAPLVVGNMNIQLLSFSNCMAQDGIVELSDAIVKNPNTKVSYWDLSKNPFSDIAPFLSALARIQSPIFYLDLSFTNMSSEATTILFKAIHSNKNLWEIRYLHIEGASFSNEAVNLFAKHLCSLSSADKAVLKSLNVGNIGSKAEILLTALCQYPQPLESLKLVKTSFNKKSHSELIRFLSKSETLRELDVSGTRMSPEMIAAIVATIATNEQITQMSLKMNDLGLHGSKLTTVLDSFERNNLLKWTNLSLDSNGMEVDDLKAFLKKAMRMVNLRGISLGDNFTYKMKTIDKELVSILELPNLESLSLKGGKHYLKDKFSKLFKELKTNETLRVLDVSYNRIGEKGLEEICDLVETNSSIVEIQIDGSQPKDNHALVQFFDTVSHSNTVHSSIFPTNDVYMLLQTASSNKRDIMYELFSSKQRNAHAAMQKNQAALGMHSDLSKKQIPELDDVLDNITMAVHERLEGIKINQHTGLAKAFGLPMPHLSEKDDQEQGAVESHAHDNTAKDYDLEGSNITVIEDNNSDLDGLQTLQFNSLCIRRPGALNVNGKRDSTGTFDNDEDNGDVKPTDMPSYLAAPVSTFEFD